jgi:hypothetical protein
MPRCRPDAIEGTITLPQDQPPPGTLRLSETEEKMRRALGLDAPPSHPERPRPAPPPTDRFVTGRPKRRFVTDGEVQVDVLHRAPANAISPGRIEAAEAALAAEREARERAERSLAETQARLRDLQTKLGHAELASAEAQAAIEAGRSETASLRSALYESEDRRQRAEADTAEARRSLEALRAELALQRAPRKPAPVAKRKTPSPAKRSAKAPTSRGKKARQTASGRDPQLVKWWLKGKSGKSKSARTVSKGKAKTRRS